MIQSVESIQLALFLRNPFAGSALQLWTSGFNADPDGFNKLPNGQTQAQGVVGGLACTILSLTTPNPRIDLVLQGVDVHPASSLPASIRDPEAALTLGLSAVERYLPKISVGRTATVVQGSNAANDKADSLSSLISLMPQIVLPDNAQDVSLQFAVSKASEIKPGRTLRRMCRFQTVSMMTVNIGFGGAQPQTVAGQAHAAHLHVDVFAEHVEALSAVDALASLREVSSLAMEAMKGESDAFAC